MTQKKMNRSEIEVVRRTRVAHGWGRKCGNTVALIWATAAIACCPQEEERLLAIVSVEIGRDRSLMFSGNTFVVEGSEFRIVNTDNRIVYFIGVHAVDAKTQRTDYCIVRASKILSNTVYSIQLESDTNQARWTFQEIGKKRYLLRLASE